MDRSKLGLNILLIVGFLVIIIFAVSVFMNQDKSTADNYPKISSKNPSRGEKNAEIVIIEYGDFQCPYCKQLAPLFKNIESEYEGKVRLIWKDFPLVDIHEHSLRAAEVARCAQEQGKFWEMHDKLFENQINLADEIYVSLAEEVGLDQNKFINCVSNAETMPLIEKDVEEGLALGVVGTPHFFINRYEITELISYEQIKMLIETELL